MDAITALKERRSVRKYKNETVDRALMTEIIELSRWAPSWANLQIARYTLVDDKETIKKIAEQGVKGFAYNMATLENAPGVAVLSFVKGKSGKLGDKVSDADYDQTWEAFDAGIACQTFCLAAHAKGVGTCIFGVIDKGNLSTMLDIPQQETIGAVIVYGYEEGEHAKPTSRKPTDEILRFFTAK